MKVLHIGEYVNGGVATYLKDVISFQSNLTDVNNVYLMLSNNSENQNFPLEEKNIYYYNYSRRSIILLIKSIMKINKKIREINPDIVHVHSTFAGFFVRLPLFFQKKSYKVIYCSHGWSFLMDTSVLKKKLYVFIERLLAIKTDMIINISKNEYINSLKYNLPKEKSIVIYNGINSKINKTEITQKIDKSKINLLFVGRYDKQKGLDILLDFFKNNKLNNINLYTIGSAILEDQNLHFPSNVKNIGWVDNKILDSYYQLFDAIIIPSRWEGFGLVAIEAMKNKKAVIVSNRGALPELVEDKYNGYIFDLDDLMTLKNILDNISKEKLIALGENGYKKFSKDFTSDIMNQRIIEIYFNLLKSKV